MKWILFFSLFLVCTSDAAIRNVLKGQDAGHVIKSSTSCRPSKWGGQLENSCLCCLVKHTPKEGVEIRQGRKILTGCAKNCPPAVLSAISRNIRADSNDPVQFLAAVLRENSGLHYVLMHPHELTPQGALTPESAASLLQRGGIQGRIEARPLGGGGFQTLQLFLVSIDGHPRYILKGLKEAFREVANNETIRKSKLAPYLQQRPNMPSIALDVNNYVYKFQGKERYFSLLNRAPGRDIAGIIFDWARDSTSQEKESRASWAMRVFGESIGKIHVEFMTPKGAILGNTAVHGDMHPYNVFFDPETSHITFIDNETFAISLTKPQDATIDIMKLFTRLVALKSERHTYKNTVDETLFYDKIVRPFVEGYIHAYGNQAELAFQKLFQVMTGQGAVKTWLKSHKANANPLELYKTQQLYAKQMFANIARDKRYALSEKEVQPTRKSRLFRRG